MQYLPVFMRLAGRSALLVGGGTVAARKAELLRRAGAVLTVVAPRLCPSLDALRATGEIEHCAEVFRPVHLQGVCIVVVATDDRAVNAAVASEAEARGIPVNVVDEPERCGFIMPAIVDRSPVIVAVSTGGAAPVLATLLRGRIEAILEPGLGRVALWSRRWRSRIRAAVGEPGARRRLWQTLLDGPAARLVASGREREADALVESSLVASCAHRPTKSRDIGVGVGAGRVPAAFEVSPGADGFVSLVGAGPGAADLLTLRAARLLREADVIVHDRLVSNDVLDLARRDAERIDVGKRRNLHRMAQQDINALLVTLGQAGKRVVRLKGGDPLVFGRGGEEAQALTAAGVAYEIVPGVTAATACAASARIPLTHREVAHGCVFVTGHGKHGEPEADWGLLARSSHTLAIYMGLHRLAHISSRLIAEGRDASTPVALVERGGCDDQQVITGTLADIARHVAGAGVTGPALVVVGDVVRLRASLLAVSEMPVTIGSGSACGPHPVAA
ncbi:MAG: uroporphyrinogen-III C-methyltransferase [Gammaproteobacteria bacterium]|nr:uroporphyrinogen-III C-methyltransferase [Gammaproteobacteria bacterium]